MPAFLAASHLFFIAKASRFRPAGLIAPRRGAAVRFDAVPVSLTRFAAQRFFTAAMILLRPSGLRCLLRGWPLRLGVVTFARGLFPRYLAKSQNGAIDGRSLRLKLRNDILDVIHSCSFLWQLKWGLSNTATLVANCLLQSYDTKVELAERRYQLFLDQEAFERSERKTGSPAATPKAMQAVNRDADFFTRHAGATL